ncbi:NAD(P) transhydrogenase subunit alpha [Azospirillum sp. HJ39]
MEHPDPASNIAAFRQTLASLTDQVDALAVQVAQLSPVPVADVAGAAGHGSFFVTGLTVLVLACFVGYYVVWRVTPALHSPLMAVTNAVSSVIIVGALVAAGPAGFGFSKVLGFLAVILASVNIFGGFLVTQRMLSMFKKKGK